MTKSQISKQTGITDKAALEREVSRIQHLKKETKDNDRQITLIRKQNERIQEEINSMSLLGNFISWLKMLPGALLVCFLITAIPIICTLLIETYFLVP